MITEECRSESNASTLTAILPAYAHGPDEDAGMDLHARGGRHAGARRRRAWCRPA